MALLRATVAITLIISGAHSFSVPTPLQARGPALPLKAGGAPRVARTAPRTHAAPSMIALPLPAVSQKAVQVARWAAAGPALYSLMSINEYFTHRYYQHTGFNKSPWFQALAKFFLFKSRDASLRVSGGGHVEHHAETLDDMTLKIDDDTIGGRWRTTAAAKMLDDDPYRGTAFTWLVTGIMTVQMLPTTLPVFKLLGFSLTRTFQILMPGMLLHALVWNALHPHMHGLPDVPLRVGVPSWPMAGLRNTPYFKWLYMNHEGHHVVGGQGNYNVACPMTDHLCGTYIPQAQWRPRQATSVAAIEARKAPAAGKIAKKQAAIPDSLPSKLVECMDTGMEKGVCAIEPEVLLECVSEGNTADDCLIADPTLQ